MSFDYSRYWNGELPHWPPKMGEISASQKKDNELTLEKLIAYREILLKDLEGYKSKPNPDYVEAKYDPIYLFFGGPESFKELNIGPPPKIEAEFKPLPEFPLIFNESDIEDPSV